MSPAALGGDRLRVRAGEIDPSPTPHFTTFGRFELCAEAAAAYPRGLAGRCLLLEEADAGVDVAGVDAVFEGLGSIEGVADRSDEREAKGLMVVLVDNLDPARDAEFNRWYDEVHVPDILSAGSFHRGSRYRARDATAPAAYLAVYETDWERPAEAVQAMETRPNRAGLWDAIAAFHLAVYRRR